jgi:hypothetical protein
MGQLIEFYHPTPKLKTAPAPVEEEPTDQLPAAELLSGVMQQVGTIRDVLIITRDVDGHCGLICNLSGVAECILLIEQTKLKVLAPENSVPRGTA